MPASRSGRMSSMPRRSASRVPLLRRSHIVWAATGRGIAPDLGNAAQALSGSQASSNTKRERQANRMKEIRQECDLESELVIVAGDLNDPKFGVTQIVLDILMVNFKESLKTPEKAISTVLTLGSGQKEDVVYFDYTEADPKAADIEKLSKAAEVLKANSASKLKVTLFTNDKVEEKLLKTKDITGVLFGGKKAEDSDKLDGLMNKRKEYITSFFGAEGIDPGRIEITISNQDKTLPQAKIELIQ